MSAKFDVGDRARWNSEVGMVSGTIIRAHTRDTDYTSHVRHCCEAAAPEALSPKLCLGERVG
ncbi:hypothetical protein [Dokdonella soli]|uniref:DUF2945 domain-containing protein n=1 Tax=Dokdonella soli TaxID=529810 RepID=A0ABN1IXA2_9GAMM